MQGLGGWCIPTLFVAATDGPRNDPSPFDFNCAIEASSINFREIGRAPLFCRLLLPLSDIPQTCQDSNLQCATQQKSKGLSFQFFSDGPNWTRAFHHNLFSNPSARKKNKKKPFCALSQTFFLSALFSFRFPFSTPLHILALVYFLAVRRSKGEESGTEKRLFGRRIVVIKKFMGKMVEISFPSTMVGRDPAAAIPSKSLALGPF